MKQPRKSPRAVVLASTLAVAALLHGGGVPCAPLAQARAGGPAPANANNAFANVRGEVAARPGQRLDDRRRRLQRRRADRRRRRARGGHDGRAAGRQADRRDSHGSRRRQADPLHHQHARAPRSHRRQRQGGRGGRVDRRRQLRRPGRRRRGQRGVHLRARERAEPAGQPAGSSRRCRSQAMADRHVLRPTRKEIYFNGEAVQLLHQPNGAHRRRHPSSSSASRTWSWPATSSSPPPSR